ncbi:glycosyltransferase family 9 protein [uncultured Helicobacter sp.]|uniref:glycosyltransferase family 9 protein n=1 Tax=uncultured Helicobacter sp. TaxID=175537 RepID=UPI00262522DE|nr:glycosyltransferase family 9 protein [uncultured Helicobacter sp.]
MNIGFYRASLIGDNMVALYGIYAMKCLHPDATLIVYTNAYGINLYSQFHFIDVLIDVGEMSEKTLIEDINSRNFALFILTQSNRAACHIFKQTNIKRIITFMTRWSFAKQRFDTVYIPRFSIAYVPYVLRLPQYKRILKLVYHNINPPPPRCNLLHKPPKIDFSPIRLQSSPSHKARIADFLHKHNLQNRPIVAINPFVYTTSHNLTLEGWRELITHLARTYPYIGFVIPTYKDNAKICFDDMENVAIFNNDSDLLNIVALLESTSLFISPSTGLSHIADNLGTPMIWLCSRRDSFVWVGETMNPKLFVILKQRTSKMSEQAQKKYIELAKQKFQVVIKDLNAR